MISNALCKLFYALLCSSMQRVQFCLVERFHRSTQHNEILCEALEALRERSANLHNRAKRSLLETNGNF